MLDCEQINVFFLDIMCDNNKNTCILIFYYIRHILYSHYKFSASSSFSLRLKLEYGVGSKQEHGVSTCTTNIYKRESYFATFSLLVFSYIFAIVSMNTTQSVNANYDFNEASAQGYVMILTLKCRSISRNLASVSFIRAHLEHNL